MATKELSRPTAPVKMPPNRPGVPAPRRYFPFDAIQSEIDRVFDRFGGFGALPSNSPIFSDSWQDMFAMRAFAPSMQVTETDGIIEVTTELPGLDEKDVEIDVADGTLTIRGEKKFEKDEKTKDYRLTERNYGSFCRVVALPSGVDAAKVKAKMSKGVLTVEIPKPADAKSQHVKISTE